MTGPSNQNETDQETGTGVGVLEREKIKKPKMYKVLMHNDDYTTMEFVIYVLKRLFAKNQREATQIMYQIHNDGLATVGIFTFEVSETKVLKATQLAKQEGHPLRCTMEPED